MIMDLAPGRPLLDGLDGAGAVTSGLGLLRRLPDVLATASVRLHALDPELIRDQLAAAGPAGLGGLAGAGPAAAVAGQVGYAPVTVPELISAMGGYAAGFGRSDLASAARWLTGHAPALVPDVICHGDLHPFNLLADGDRITVLDWSNVLIGPRAHDVAFTSLLLSEPPLDVSGWGRPPVRALGRLLAGRFVRRYQRAAGVRISAGELRYHQAVVCLRALTEVAGWVHQGTAGERSGHPWLVSGPAFARRLSRLTGIPVRPR
jgi:hypothetical protein